MGNTISEKILARASGQESVEAGDFVMANVDVVLMPDITSVLAFEAMKAAGSSSVWDAEKVVLVLDHIAPPSSINAAKVHKAVREFVKEQGIRNFYDVQSGVCHQVLPENGYVKPGYLVIGADSHTCTHGALGAFATGVGSTDMGAILAKGKVWLKAPESIKVVIDGDLPKNVYSKDVILKTAGEIGVSGASYMTIEFSGETIDDMSVSSRMTLCNMAIEMGGKAGICEPDVKTFTWLDKCTDGNYEPVYSDKDANYKRILELNVKDLEPLVACPHNVDNVKPVNSLGRVEINQSFIGSCTNGRLEDLEVAHDILRGKQVHPDVRLLIVPASRKVFREALEKGFIKDFLDAGAVVSNPSCAACFGGHIGILAPGEKAVTTSNRNFRGRQGSPEAEVYLCSPAVAAASAILGYIADPKEVV